MALILTKTDNSINKIIPFDVFVTDTPKKSVNGTFPGKPHLSLKTKKKGKSRPNIEKPKLKSACFTVSQRETLTEKVKVRLFFVKKKVE
jgi:hypothetical protein